MAIGLMTGTVPRCPCASRLTSGVVGVRILLITPQATIARPTNTAEITVLPNSRVGTTSRLTILAATIALLSTTVAPKGLRAMALPLHWSTKANYLLIGLLLRVNGTCSRDLSPARGERVDPSSGAFDGKGPCGAGVGGLDKRSMAVGERYGYHRNTEAQML